MVNAKFTITGSASSNRGYDAVHNQVLNLQLEDLPATDIFRCVYSLGKYSGGAPTPTFSAFGVASPVGSIVTLTMPGVGTHVYEVICTVNNGVDTNGNINPNYTFSRIVAIRSPESLRKIIAGETTEYFALNGWAEAVNEMIDGFSSAVAGAFISSLSGTSPIQVTAGATPVISIIDATTSLRGAMSSADKTKLDNATSLNTASRLAIRGASGELDVGKLRSFNGGTSISIDPANFKIESNTILTIKTIDSAGASQSLSNKTGQAANGFTGNLTHGTGDAVGAGFASGFITQSTGSSSGGNSGNNNRISGNCVAKSGDLNDIIGTGATRGNINQIATPPVAPTVAFQAAVYQGPNVSSALTATSVGQIPSTFLGCVTVCLDADKVINLIQYKKNDVLLYNASSVNGGQVIKISK